MANKQVITKKLLTFTKEQIQDWLKTFDAVLTDCDGVLWHDENAIPNVSDVINKLQIDYGKRVYFVTNNGTKTRREIWQRAIRMNYQVDKESQIIAPSYTIAEYLHKHHGEKFKTKKVYIIGMESIAKELEAFGIQHFGVGPDVVHTMRDVETAMEHMLANEKVGAVVVAFDEHFSYSKMMKATNYLTSSHGHEWDCLFLTTNTDPVHKYPKFHLPGTGALVKAIETSSGREAMEMGKPNPIVCEQLLAEGLITPERTLVIGDSCEMDIQFGKNCGFHTLLVGSGHDTWDSTLVNFFEDPEKYEQLPDYYLPSLGDLLEFL